jgi:hypothetical protein
VGIRKRNREKKIWEAAISIILVRTFFKSLTNKQGNLPKKIAIYTKAACQESPEHHDSK